MPSFQTAGGSVQDAVAPTAKTLPENLLFFAHDTHTSDRPSIHGADAGRLPDTRLVGAGNGSRDRAYGSSASCPVPTCFPAGTSPAYA